MDILSTILIIIEQTCLHLPLVVGAYISFSLMKLPDLSIEAAYLCGALLAARCVMLDLHVPFVLLALMVFIASLLGGLLVGALSSILHRYVGIPHLLASILTVGVFHGVNQFFLGTSMVSLSRHVNILNCLTVFSQTPELIMLLIVTGVVVVTGYVLLKTQLGYTYAVFGMNPRFFEHYGISTNVVVLSGVMFANSLAGISGYCVAQSNGFLDLYAGQGMALFCITALILGKAFTRSKKVFSMVVPVLGTVSYFVMMQLLLKIGFNQKYFTLLQALLVIGVLAYTYRGRRRSMLGDHLGV